jgi:alginate O-acetyltransferase complex protein AlgI
MLFNSAAFIFKFLPLALLGFAVLGRFGRRAAIGWLAFISIVFYMAWKPAFVVLLLGSIALNFLLSRLIAASKTKPRVQSFWLITGIAGNLGALCYFKYLFPLLHFFTRHGWSQHEWGNVVLPLGISFFTFTQLGYLIDLRDGVAEPQSLTSYALFVTFFPHLIAGPILHHKEIMPQFAEERQYGLNRADLSVGLTWFVMGLCKKVLIADMIAPYADAVFAAPAQQSIATAWIGAVTYVLQLYFDFSGYSDMAIGLARMFSIRFPFNFNSPYKAASVIEYWQRWHMTLTHYITLYLYSPIALNVRRRRLDAGKAISKKATRTLEGFVALVAYPTVVTMLLAGIWHGAGLQFILFGLIHGVCITLEHAWNLFRPSNGKSMHPLAHMAAVLRVSLTVVIADIFFRAPSVRGAWSLLRSMFGMNGVAHQTIAGASLLALLLLPVVWLFPNTQEILGETAETGKSEASETLGRFGLRWKPNFAWALLMGATVFLVLLNMSRPSTFLYFQF